MNRQYVILDAIIPKKKLRIEPIIPRGPEEKEKRRGDFEGFMLAAEIISN